VKITRRQLRKLILEVYVPGSPADLYDRYGITSAEQEQLAMFTKSDDRKFRKQGRELAWDAYEMPIVSSETFKVITGMKNAVDALRIFIDDIPNDMKRRGLSTSIEEDMNKYFYNVWMPMKRGDEDEYSFSNFQHQAILMLNARAAGRSHDKLLQAYRRYSREWNEANNEAINKMGF